MDRGRHRQQVSTNEQNGEVLDDPVVITDLDELQSIDDDPDGEYVLGNDIDASETADADFSPIRDFSGEFDGDGHTISELTIERAESSEVGLFGNVTEEGTVRNVSIEAVDVIGEDETGGLVGINEGTVEVVSVSGDVEGDSEIGGLVGDNNGQIEQAYATTRVDGRRNVGGLVGDNDGSIEQVYATGLVEGEERVGGLVGENGFSGVIRDTYSLAEVVGKDTVGGLVGRQRNDVETSFAAEIVAGESSVGGFAGGQSDEEIDCYWDVETTGLERTAGDASGLGTDEMEGDTAQESLEGFDFEVEGIWETVDGEFPVLAELSTDTQLDLRPLEREQDNPILDAMDGDGSGRNPFQITSTQELIGMGADPVAFYELTADLDGEDELEGISPAADTFFGSFQGNDHTVSNVTVEQPDSERVGLFGYVVESGIVENLRATDIKVTGDDQTGGLAGENGGIIRDVRINSTVSGDRETGGVIGKSTGTGLVVRCGGEDVTVDGRRNVGGLVGDNNGQIEQVYATGLVEGEERVGGLVGENGFSGVIRDTYSLAEVVGEDTVGGLVGRQRNDVETSFAAEIVAGESSVGGFVGGQSDEEIDCYWDVETTGLDTSSGAATGRDTDEMQGNEAETALEGFDFDETWETAEEEYPVLESLPTDAQLDLRPLEREPPTPVHEEMDGDGSARDPYVVTDAEQFMSLGADPSAFYELRAGIDMSDETYEPQSFIGNLDGFEYQIGAVTVDQEDTDTVGVFDHVGESGVIRNLRLASIEITGDTNTGGLVGENDGLISDLRISATVSGDRNTGGLVGENKDEGRIREIAADVTVEGEDTVGGLVGENDGTISEVKASGFVEGIDEVGGLVGDNGFSGVIRDSYSLTEVDGEDVVGGFAGDNDNDIETSFAAGPVTGESNVGGFVAFSDTEIDCYWDQEATGLDESGGDATGLTTFEMQDALAASSMEEFDFDDTWQIVEDDYPTLIDIPEELGPVVLTTPEEVTIPTDEGGSFTIEGESVTEIVLSKLWIGWDVSGSADGATFEERIDEDSTASFEWEQTASEPEPTITIDPSEQYVGGEYRIDVIAENDRIFETIEQSIIITLES